VIGFLIGLVIFGLVVGALGRLAIPGRQPMGCLGTIGAGLAGSFIAGLIGRAIFGKGYTGSFILSVLGAALVVWIVAKMAERRATGTGS
jgi:uncharacterized membrane protein YeaQ/YmgE (transglycosylase-associated protein family)